MDTQVRDVAERSRYELLVDGEVAGFAEYRSEGEHVVFPHTVIDPQRRGQGLGAILVRGALDAVRPSGHKVVPSCWYVAQVIAENPEYADLRSEERRVGQEWFSTGRTR